MSIDPKDFYDNTFPCNRQALAESVCIKHQLHLFCAKILPTKLKAWFSFWEEKKNLRGKSKFAEEEMHVKSAWPSLKKFHNNSSMLHCKFEEGLPQVTKIYLKHFKTRFIPEKLRIGIQKWFNLNVTHNLLPQNLSKMMITTLSLKSSKSYSGMYNML